MFAEEHIQIIENIEAFESSNTYTKRNRSYIVFRWWEFTITCNVSLSIWGEMTRNEKSQLNSWHRNVYKILKQIISQIHKHIARTYNTITKNPTRALQGTKSDVRCIRSSYKIYLPNLAIQSSESRDSRRGDVFSYVSHRFYHISVFFPLRGRKREVFLTYSKSFSELATASTERKFTSHAGGTKTSTNN